MMSADPFCDNINAALDNLERSRPCASPSSSCGAPAPTAPGVPLDMAALEKLTASVPRPDKHMVYGTAGFRDKSAVLHSTCLRMGLIAALRSIRKGAPVGVMITASHNPPPDNGMKIADASGGMLDASWEPYCTEIANSEDPVAALKRIAADEGLETALCSSTRPSSGVFIGWDTRPSSVELKELCAAGVRALGGVVYELGVVTTPQLHHVVYSHNRGELAWASVDGYYDKLAHSFREVVAGDSTGRGPLIIDCAHGVGALHIDPINARLGTELQMEMFNTQTDVAECLNVDCGAEHVQKKRLPPANAAGPGRFASFDGDADRVVMFWMEPEFQLLDGDKIAVLAADFLADQLKDAGCLGKPVNLGVVQTAYANGAAHDYVLGKGVACPYAKTGVKYCHHVAEQFDIGVYFEANGHGTAIVKDWVVDAAEKKLAAAPGASEALALRRLLGSARLLNQAVGDSTADAMFVEAVLAARGWTVQDWADMYTDKPSRQTKVYVKDRTVVKPIADETRLHDDEAGSPSALLQGKIDALCAAANGRGFCRPSGTEDVVRVYGEAATEEEADKLANAIAIAIHETVNGVGDRPELGKWL